MNWWARIGGGVVSIIPVREHEKDHKALIQVRGITSSCRAMLYLAEAADLTLLVSALSGGASVPQEDRTKAPRQR
jgi:hypothetical protein